MNFEQIKDRILTSKLFKDSFWAVLGSGIGNFLLLIAGIIIARKLGKDLYGEYGMVKTTMFQISNFAALGLGYTSTKFIAEYIARDKRFLRSIGQASLKISLLSSLILCALLFLFSDFISNNIGEPQLSEPFKYLGVIIVFRTIGTSAGGILAGFKNFKFLALSNILSGIIMLFLGALLVFLYGLVGSLIALLTSQAVFCLINLKGVFIHFKQVQSNRRSFDKELFRYTFPVALQELTWFLSVWGASLILTKFSSLGELGLWSAASQWNAIVIFLPSVLVNVVISYLSGHLGDAQSHRKLVNRMLLINFMCVLLPFICVFLLSDIISSFYGSSFEGLGNVLNAIVFSTIFYVLSKVYESELISTGHNWSLFILRSCRDICILAALYFSSLMTIGTSALVFAYIYIAAYAIYLIVIYCYYNSLIKHA